MSEVGVDLMNSIRVVMVWMLSLFSSLCYGANILTAAQDDWPPFVIEKDNSGLAVEIVRSAFASQHISLEVNYVPWARVLYEVKKNRFDLIIGAWYSEERSEYLEFSQPYFINRIVFVTGKDNPTEYAEIDDLKGLSVGVVRGYAYGEDFDRDTRFHRDSVKDDVSNLHKLLAKRIDVTVGDPMVLKYVAQQHGLKIGAIRFSQTDLSANPLHVAVSKTHPDRQAILDTFNRGLSVIQNNGTYLKLLQKYGAQKSNIPTSTPQ